MMDGLRPFLLARRGEDRYFESELSDSAVSTAVACIALEIADAERYAPQIRAAKDWLLTHQNADGLYGDSPESPANLTATFLGYVCLARFGDCDDAGLERCRDYLLGRCGDFSFAAVRRVFLQEYGKDLTFSVPILALATAAGFFADARGAWGRMPRLPFELATLPEQLFHLLHLPVVSYAIPALICIGLAQHAQVGHGLWGRVRTLTKSRALRVLTRKQPESGGFLEAAPLTGFCALCLCVAGLSEHPVTKNALRFLLETQRANGAWPIDHDLRQWVTSLALPVLADTFTEEEKASYRDRIKKQQTTTRHPYTRSPAGGWGWTTRSGSVPDADDTAAALIALHALGEGASSAVCAGVSWLLRLQNSDGGIPTFCRGWGTLPFDRSCPDLAAHTFKAFSLYEEHLPSALQQKVRKAKAGILRYLATAQAPDGSFVPLWFGDQLAEDKAAPVYGSAVVLEHLSGAGTEEIRRRAKEYLLAQQHDSGGWGGAGNQKHDSVIFTARCVCALRPFADAAAAVQRGLAFLQPYRGNPQLAPREPVGLYFAHLWYAEALYVPIFLAACGEGQ